MTTTTKRRDTATRLVDLLVEYADLGPEPALAAAAYRHRTGERHPAVEVLRETARRNRDVNAAVDDLKARLRTLEQVTRKALADGRGADYVAALAEREQVQATVRAAEVYRLMHPNRPTGPDLPGPDRRTRLLFARACYLHRDRGPRAGHVPPPRFAARLAAEWDTARRGDPRWSDAQRDRHEALLDEVRAEVEGTA